MEKPRCTDCMSYAVIHGLWTVSVYEFHMGVHASHGDPVPPTNYQRIWDVVAQIPHGRVATYGQIARLAGLGQHARLVGYALHHSPIEHDLAWHRVINANGKISFPHSSNRYHRQRAKLEAEGIVFTNARVDLNTYRWRPTSEGFPDEYFAQE